MSETSSIGADVAWSSHRRAVTAVAALLTIGAACSGQEDFTSDDVEVCERLRAVALLGVEPSARQAALQEVDELDDALANAQHGNLSRAAEYLAGSMRDWATGGEFSLDHAARAEEAAALCREAGVVLPGDGTGSD
jgi:hypothetical protein